eukprot:scaffold184_cov379-Prasinococcus_capsulatus_cf.AAC.4
MSDFYPYLLQLCQYLQGWVAFSAQALHMHVHLVEGAGLQKLQQLCDGFVGYVAPNRQNGILAYLAVQSMRTLQQGDGSAQVTLGDVQNRLDSILRGRSQPEHSKVRLFARRKATIYRPPGCLSHRTSEKSSFSSSQICSRRLRARSSITGLKRNLAQREAMGSMMRET